LPQRRLAGQLVAYIYELLEASYIIGVIYMPKYAYARPGSSWLESVGAKQTLERMRTRIKMSQTLKRKLADQAVGTILVTMNLVWNDGSGTVTVLLLDAAICWHGFVSSLREASCFRGPFPPKDL
jgi:hypothetical protein